MTMPTSDAQERPGLTGATVLAILLAFFVTVLSVDALMIVRAVQSRPGLVTEGAYEKGLAHNALLAAEARQEALGWQAGVKVADGRLVLDLREKDGALMVPTRIDLRLIRPTNSGMDRSLMAVPVPDGTWAADLAGVGAGQWEVAIVVHRGDDRMDVLERVVIR